MNLFFTSSTVGHRLFQSTASILSLLPMVISELAFSFTSLKWSHDTFDNK